MSTSPGTIRSVIATLARLEDIRRPEGDNEGLPINAPAVLDSLAPEDQKLVLQAAETLSSYVRKNGDMGMEANQRSLTELRKHGFPAALNEDQYDSSRLVGSVTVRDWKLDLSDPETNSNYQ